MEILLISLSASLLRQIVAGPRARHPEAGLDLCYVTEDVIATSGPSNTYPQLAYRNPLNELVKFLDSKHKEEWQIWEFRAEGTGYPDEEVYGRIRHYPFPDHHPPPFAIVPKVMADMRNWMLAGNGRVIVVHCKAGKGRSGTMACSYLVSECDWKLSDALARFTERRMRPGFGQGISIPSQLRYLYYVDRWVQHGKLYVERQVEIVEVRTWGLRDGVKVAIESYVDDGKLIKSFHIFSRDERIILDDKEVQKDETASAAGLENQKKVAASNFPKGHDSVENGGQIPKSNTTSNVKDNHGPIVPPPDETHTGDERGGTAVIFKPKRPVIIPTNDINIDFERRNKAGYGWSMVTSVAHVWFNSFFEGNGPENEGQAAESGVFEIDWDKMDGIKGSIQKGTRALDKVAVVWRIYKGAKPEVIREPQKGEAVSQMKPADWKGIENPSKELGLRSETPRSANVSKASSLHSAHEGEEDKDAEGVKAELSPADREEQADQILSRTTADAPNPSAVEATESLDTADHTSPAIKTDAESSSVAGVIQGAQHVATSDLPGGKPEDEMEDAHQNVPGHLEKIKNAFSK